MRFSLFGKKEPSVKVVDKVWINTGAKWKACQNLFWRQPATIFIAWFEESRNQLLVYVKAGNENVPQVILYREASAHLIKNGKVVFIEHHPMKRKEQQLFTKLGLSEAIVYSSLDEAFFKHFGGERIIDVIKSIGTNEDECIENAMVSKAIINAQQKIEKQITVEQSAGSQSEWMRKNIGI